MRFVARAGGTIIRPTRKGEFMSRKLLLAGASAVAILVAANAAGAKSYTIPGMYTFTVPTTGEYAIDLVGASGGSNFAANPPGGLPGGLGAEVFGDVMLQAGGGTWAGRRRIGPPRRRRRRRRGRQFHRGVRRCGRRRRRRPQPGRRRRARGEREWGWRRDRRGSQRLWAGRRRRNLRFGGQRRRRRCLQRSRQRG